MSDTKLVRTGTLNRLADLVKNMKCVQLWDLRPFTTLFVRTIGSLYRVVIDEGPRVHMQGGAWFPEPTSAFIDGASGDGSSLMVGRICVGFRVEIRAGGRRIVTSPVRSISSLESPATQRSNGQCL